MRRTPLFALLLLAGAVLPSAAEAQSRAIRGERRIVCRGATIPAGWILVDDLRDRSMCSGENPTILRMYNVWAIERIDNRPGGTVIQVCAATPTPTGWELVDVFRDPASCGHPTDPLAVNVKRIRRAG
jgi:hypothetical protein